MRILVFNGSPRGKRGNTQIMVDAFAEGVRRAGGELETIFLVNQNIRYCTGCFGCWTRTPGKCVLDDDMAGLLTRILEADVIAIATPLYVDNVTGLTKTFMDRLIPLGLPEFHKDEAGECRHPSRYDHVPKMLVFANCGFPEQSHFQILRPYFRRVARNFNTEIVGEIYRGAGEALNSPSVMAAPFLTRYRKLLEEAGQELVEKGRLSDEMTARLEKPLVPEKIYIRGANKHWAHLIQQSQEEAAKNPG